MDDTDLTTRLIAAHIRGLQGAEMGPGSVAGSAAARARQPPGSPRAR